jgi:hypothetical protein
VWTGCSKLIIYQAAVKNVIEIEIYIIMKHKFLVDSKILNWTNKARFREELPLRISGSKKLTNSESSFTRVVVFQLLKFVDANLHHANTHIITVTSCSLLKFIQVSLSKVKVKLLEGIHNT